MFLPFYRAANAAHGSPEGLGLGLAFSRDIVAAHGGRLWAEAAPGGGSIFHVALPLRGSVRGGTLSAVPGVSPVAVRSDDGASGQPSA